jgi:hypothetical protein
MADNTSFIFFLVRLVLRVHASVIFIGGYREDNFKIQMITKETCTYVIHTYLGTGYPLFLPNPVRVSTVPRCNHVLKARCHYQSFWWNFGSDNGQRNLWFKTLTNFDGIELHPIFLQTLMEINQSEYCFGMMRWCLQNKNTW